MRGTVRVVIGGLALLLNACVSERLHYDRGLNSTRVILQVNNEQPAHLIAHIVAALDSKDIASLLFIGPTRRPRELADADIGTWAAFNVDFLRLLRQVLAYGHPGLEADVYVTLPDPVPDDQIKRRTYAVTVTWSLDNAIVVRSGAHSLSLGPDAPSVQDLHKRFGIHAVASGTAPWTARERHALEAAFTRMPQSDLPLIKDIAFWRMTAPTKGSAGVLARYRLHGERGQIQIYDGSVTWAAMQFCGDLNNPAPVQTLSILHEIGHALSQAGRARRLRALGLIDQRLDQARARVRQIDALLKAISNEQQREKLRDERRRLNRRRVEWRTAYFTEVPAILIDHKFQDSVVSQAFNDVLPQHLAVTAYGATQIEESFAEAYALFACDPGALERISLDAWAFFDAGRHVQLAQIAIDEVDAAFKALLDTTLDAHP